MADIKEKVVSTVKNLYENQQAKDEAMLKASEDNLAARNERVQERRDRLEKQKFEEAEKASQLDAQRTAERNATLNELAGEDSIRGKVAQSIVNTKEAYEGFKEDKIKASIEEDKAAVERRNNYIDSQRPFGMEETSTEDLTKRANELATERGYEKDFSTLSEAEKKSATRFIDEESQPASYADALDKELRSKAENFIRHPNMTIFSQSISNGFRMGLEKGWARLTEQQGNMLETRLKRGVRGVITPERNKETPLTKLPKGIDSEELTNQHKQDFDMLDAQGVAYNEAMTLSEDILQSSRDIAEDAKVKYMDMENENNKSIESMDKGYMKLGAHLATGLAEMTTDYSSHIRDAMVGIAVKGTITGINTGVKAIRGKDAFTAAYKGATKLNMTPDKAANLAGKVGSIVANQTPDFIGKGAAKAIEYVAFGASSIAQNKSDVELIKERDTTFAEDIQVGTTSLLFKGLSDLAAWGAGRTIGNYNPNANPASPDSVGTPLQLGSKSESVTNVNGGQLLELKQGDALNAMTKYDVTGMPYNTLTAQGFFEPMMMSTYTSPIQLDMSLKQVGRIGLNNENGKLSQELIQFRRSDITPKNYDAALDPRNVRTSVVDGINDTNYANPQGEKLYLNNGSGQPVEYNLDNNTTIMLSKTDLEKGVINQTQYDSIVNGEIAKAKATHKNATFVDDTVGEVIVPSREVEIGKAEIIPEPSQDVQPIVAQAIKENIAKGKTAVTKVYGSNQIQASEFQDVLKKTADPATLRGTIAKVTDEDSTHFMYKANEDNTTIISINKENYKNRNVDPKSKSFKEDQMQYIMNGASIKTYDQKTNRIIDVQGMKKLDYYMGMVSTEAMDRFTRPMQLTANALQAEKNSKGLLTASRAKDIRVNLAVGQTVIDLAQAEWDKKVANKTSILMGIDTIFADGLGKVYNTIGDSLSELSTPSTLARLYVEGGTLTPAMLDKPIVNSSSNVDLKVNGHQAYISRLVETNDFLTAFKKKSNYIASADDDIAATKVASRFPNIFQVDETGNLVFSDSPTSLMGSGKGTDTILDLYLNPNKVGIGGDTAETVGTMKYFNDYGIKSMDDVDVIMSYYDRDDINGLAISKVFTDPDQLRLLKDYGITHESIDGTPNTNVVDYLYGLSGMLLDYNDPQYSGDRTLLKETLDLFKDYTKMPKKTIIEVGKGTTEVDMNLSDFIAYQPEVDVSMKDINGVFSDTMTEYGITIENQVSNLVQRRKDTLYRRLESHKKSRDEAVGLVDKMIRGFQRYNSPNQYMNSEHFKKAQARLLELGGELNTDLGNLVKMDTIGALKGKEYTGRISEKTPVIKTFQSAQEKLQQALPEIKNSVHSITQLKERMNGTDLKKFVTSKKFNNHIQRLVDNVDSLGGVDREALTMLAQYNNQNYTQSDRTLIKDLVDRVYNTMDKVVENTEEAYKNLGKIHNQLVNTANPRTTIKSKEFTDTYDLVKSYLPAGMQSDADGVPFTLSDIDEYLGYATDNIDANIDVNDIVYKLRNQMVDLQDYMGDLPETRIAEINRGYDGLYKSFDELNKKLAASIDNPIRFFKNNNLQSIKQTLVDFNIQAGRPFDEDELLNIDLLNVFKGVLDNVVESKKKNPINNFRQKNFTRFKKTSTKADLTINRMSQVIDIEQWHRDRGMYKSGSFASTDVQTKAGYRNKIADLENLNLDELELTNLPENFFDTYVADNYKERMQHLHENVAKLFKPVVYEVDADGTPIRTESMNLDQFTLVYYQFLKDLSKTRGVSNAISKAKGEEAGHLADLLPYFNDMDDMKSFFIDSIDGREGYVKGNAAVLDSVRGVTADTMADLATWGRSQASWGYTLVNSKGKNMSLALDRTKEKLTNGTKELYAEVDEMATRVMKDVGNKLINAAIPSSDSFTEKTLKARDANSVIKSVVDMAKMPVMWGVGATEYVFKDMHVYNRIHNRDVWGRGTAGSGWKQAYGNIKNSLVGTYTGFADAPLIFGDLSTSAMRGILAVDRAIGLEAAITSITGKEFEFQPKEFSETWTKARILKRAGKREGDIGHLISQAQRVYSTNRYLDSEAKSFGSGRFTKMTDTLKAESNTLQDIAANKAFVLSYINTAQAIDATLKGGFYDMTGENQTKFRRAGIVPENWEKFKEFVNVEMKDAEGNYKYDILSLNGYKTTDWDNNELGDGLKTVATSFFNSGYEENRHSKFEDVSGNAKILNTIFGAFRGTTIGVAQDDLTRIFFSMDEMGVWRNKFTGKWNRNSGEIMKQYGNMLLAIGGLASGLIIQGEFTPLLNSVLKKHQDINKEISKLAGDTLYLSRAAELESFDDYMEFTSGIIEIARENVTSNLAASVYLSDGNNIIENSYRTYMKTVQSANLMLNKYRGTNPYMTAEYGKKIFGFDVTKVMSEEEFETSTQGMLALNFIQSVGALAPMAWTTPMVDRLTTDSTVYSMEQQERAIKQLKGGNEKLEMDRLEALQKVTDATNEARYNAGNMSFNINNILKNEEMSVEDLKTQALLVLDLFERKSTSDLQQLSGMNYQMANGINDVLLKNDKIDEKTHESNAVEIFNSAGLQEQYDRQPMVVKVVMDSILDLDKESSTKIKNDTKLLMMSDIQQGMSMKEIVNKYAGNPMEVNKLVREKQSALKSKKTANKSFKQVKSYTEIPAVYKKMHKVLVGNGNDISEEDMIKMYNDGLTMDDLRTLNK